MTLQTTTLESMSDDQIQKRLNELTATSDVPGPIPQDRLESMSDGGIQHRLAQLGAISQPLLTIEQQQDAYNMSLRDGTN
ncbi:hypothetical protein LCGC14_1894830, partial [marine sediment metagenome]